MKVVAVLGTRPEVIKLAPVIAELRRQGADTVVVSTGQHRELLDQMLEQFGLVPDIDLAVMRPRQLLSELTAALVAGLGDVLRGSDVDWVLVQGDTTTTLCGALAGFYEGVPVAHIEANRTLVARLASLHFCPTAGSAANLIAESVPDEHVIVTGNTVIDALLWALEHARRLPSPVPRTRSRRILLTLHRRESHGDAMHRVCDAVSALVRRGDIEVVLPVHRSPAVRNVVVPRLEDVEGVHLCAPLDYLSFIHVLDECELVLTDSGGLQEEGPTLGKPVLVLRDTTERPEAVDAGVARLVGTDPSVIIRETRRLLDDPIAYAAMAHPQNPFGDGFASRRIVEALAEFSELLHAA